jgi:hypothetical protein
VPEEVLRREPFNLITIEVLTRAMESPTPNPEEE